MSRYEIGLCQQYSLETHGFVSDTSSPDIYGHYLCLYTFDFMDPRELSFLNHICKCHADSTIEIVETHMLFPGQEIIAIYKTFWLRIFQRKCRKWVLMKRYSRTNQIYSFLMKREYQATKIVQSL